MTEDERAQMCLEECLHNAGLKEDSPFKKEEADEIESSLDFLSLYDS